MNNSVNEIDFAVEEKSNSSTYCYEDTSSFSSESIADSILERSSMKLCFANVDTLSNKMAELDAYLSVEKPAILGLCEVYPKTSTDKSVFDRLCFRNYDLICPNTVGDRGVLLLIRKDLKATRVETFDIIDYKEHVWCEVGLQGSDSLLIGMIYRSPSATLENNMKLIELINKSSDRGYSHYVLMGDFNYKEINWLSQESNYPANSPGDVFYECVKDNFLHQHIQEPTRLRDGQNPSCLDLLFTNDELMVTQETLCIGPPLGSSDHACISCELCLYSEGSNVDREYYQYFKGDYDELRIELLSADWDTIFTDLNVEQMWQSFKDILNNAISKHIPKKKHCKNNKESPLWMDKTTKLAILAKRKAWKKYKYSRSQENYRKYAVARNKCSAAVKNAKRDYERKIALEVGQNPKSFWKYVNSKRKTRESIGDLLKTDNTLAKTDEEKSEVLNNFFSSVFVRPEKFVSPEVNLNEGDCLSEITFTCGEVLKALGVLKTDKSPGPDGIHSKVLYETRHELCRGLQLIFEQSLAEGNIPDDWKKAHITPIFKKGNKKDPSNYRPVSLTSTVCKVCESLIRDQLMNFLYCNNLLSDNQYGFRAGRSCSIQLLEILDSWSESHDKGIPVDIIYLDFSKAFDSVDHSRLLFKLNKLGVRGGLLQWIESFLTNRQQCVRVGSAISSSADVVSGVPQGSVLGPVLFLCYINDLPNVVQGIVKIFADDTKIFSEALTEDHCQKLQTDLDNLCDWSREWKLSFNATKCKVLHIGHKNEQFRYTMQDTDGNFVNITSVTSEKDLGVTFDCDLNFNQHITNIVNKAQSCLGLIYRSFECLDREMFLHLYKSLVRPILEYGSSVWSPFLKKDIKRIEDIQRRATKLVTGLKHLTYEERLKELGLVTLEYRRDRADMIQIYKATHNFDHLKWDTLFTLASEDLRGHHLKFRVNKSKHNVRRNSFSVRTVHFWNSLSQETVTANSINQFKSLLNKENWNAKKFKATCYVH